MTTTRAVAAILFLRKFLFFSLFKLFIFFLKDVFQNVQRCIANFLLLYTYIYIYLALTVSMVRRIRIPLWTVRKRARLMSEIWTQYDLLAIESNGSNLKCNFFLENIFNAELKTHVSIVKEPFRTNCSIRITETSESESNTTRITVIYMMWTSANTPLS